MDYHLYTTQKSVWPVVFGSYSLSWEVIFFLLSLQAFAEKRNKRELARVIVFGSWVLFDSFCVLNTIRFGYHADDIYDDFGWFRIQTREERALAFGFYLSAFAGLLYFLYWKDLLRWFKHHSFIVSNFLFISQFRLNEVQSAYLLFGTDQSYKYTGIYVYFLFSFFSHCLFVFAKEAAGYPSPIILARLYTLQVPLANLLMIKTFPLFLQFSNFTYAVVAIVVNFATFAAGPILEQSQNQQKFKTVLVEKPFQLKGNKLMERWLEHKEDMDTAKHQIRY